ncbi:ABC transporter ATP-binding protein [Herpetosiphon llansteffanensis]|uniref:ABC transporter ATP-binding protein n=1 Tax=Herpetosiphon llansteffanensis TaxID=2094568 RepID=UPI000D7C85D6|nr:ABC transporter ATP-binding protein [Herpetosiphon llansteffanensis]
MSYLQLDQLTKSYAKQTILQNINLKLKQGEFLALLGPSGSGKSTILKILAGIEAPDAGEIRLAKRLLNPVAAHQREIVLLFQQPYLFPFLSVAENIGFGLKARKVAKKLIDQKVAELLDLVELSGMQQRKPQQLSGGQQQRVALARALAVQPKVLLLDEPLSSLDPEIRVSLQGVIARLHRELQMTTIIVTHDLSEALALAERTALLINGSLVADLPSIELFERPPNRAAAQFVGVGAIIAGQLQGTTFNSQLGQFNGNFAPNTVSLAIRPEHIQINNPASQPSIAAQILERRYLGERWEYRLQAAEQVITVREAGQTPREIGQTVDLHFPPQQLFALAD